MRIRRAESRGRTGFDWLESRHSFSFGGYWDPDWVEYGPLRVINDDRVAGGGGFPPHPHKDMEIISIVLEGKLAHRDSMGNGSVIAAGEVQYMGAGSGIVHSEMNPSPDEAVHFLQIWIQPEKTGLAPAYAQTRPELAAGKWVPVIGPEEEAIGIRQDAAIRWGVAEPGNPLTAEIAPGRMAWVQAIQGNGQLGETALAEGDALLLEAGESIRLDGTIQALWFDLPAQ